MCDRIDAWKATEASRRISHYRTPAGRVYRITGVDRRGVVTAEYLCPGQGWRAVRYGHRLHALTVAHFGDLPDGCTDSGTLEAIRPVLAALAATYERLRWSLTDALRAVGLEHRACEGSTNGTREVFDPAAAPWPASTRRTAGRCDGERAGEVAP